ncbi:hypothetical protein CLH61_07605 [Marinobacter profundi]|uniref:Uncharacterized protein n=1 Tax=Marinobacter profundi TaxID=2666256 RepID=A0A2G1UNC3_9GAMM|nr:hypothetical protein CLH61_07605 [Marinobacter profundi]
MVQEIEQVGGRLGFAGVCAAPMPVRQPGGGRSEGQARLASARQALDARSRTTVRVVLNPWLTLCLVHQAARFLALSSLQFLHELTVL